VGLGILTVKKISSQGIQADVTDLDSEEKQGRERRIKAIAQITT